MLSPAIEQFHERLAAMRANRPATPPTLEQSRAGAAGFWGGLAAPVEGVEFVPAELDGIPAEWLVPTDAGEGVLLHVHGGGYSTCSIESHRHFVGHLAKAAGCRALLVEYRLAPEHRYPAPIEDVVTAYRSLLDSGTGPASIVVAGDSAGGGLAIAAVKRMLSKGLPPPAGVILFSPLIDLAATSESLESNAGKDLAVDRAAILGLAERYLDGHDPRDPQASPLYGDLAGLPPVYVQVGGAEVLVDDAHRLAARAAETGGTVVVDVVPDMQHIFQMNVGHAEEADEAVAKAGRYAREWLTETG